MNVTAEILEALVKFTAEQMAHLPPLVTILAVLAHKVLNPYAATIITITALTSSDIIATFSLKEKTARIIAHENAVLALAKEETARRIAHENTVQALAHENNYQMCMFVLVVIVFIVTKARRHNAGVAGIA